MISHKERDKAAEVGRQCGACTACCSIHNVPGVTELGERCRFLGEVGVITMHEVKVGDGAIDFEPSYHPQEGCTIYSARPRMCSMWFCAWRLGLGQDTDRPDKTGVVPSFVMSFDIPEAGVRLVWNETLHPEAEVMAEEYATRIEAGTEHAVGAIKVDRPFGRVTSMTGGFDSRLRESK